MPPSPPGQPAPPKPIVLIKSPRDAATWAMVYRRRTRDRPRDRLLKLAGLIGTLLVHLIFLFGAILGSPYELPPPPPEPKGTPLLVRLIENKPQPPPPPIRGVPPKEHGPTHRGNTAQVAHVTHEASTAAPVAAVQQPPVPAPVQIPVVAQTKQVAAEKPQPAAAPLPPITLPKPEPTAITQPKAVGLPPPALSLPTIPAPQPVPPQFQPEPARKAQAEGTQPMPPLPSLALPNQPARSALTATPPQIAVEKPSLAPIALPNAAAVEPAPTAAAPPSPPIQPIPMPAKVAPTVNLQSSATPLITPSLPRTAQQVLAPTLRPQEAQLAPVPLAPSAAPKPNLAPSAPPLNIAAPKLAVPEVSIRPQMSTTPSTTPTTPTATPSKAPEAASSEKATAAASSPTPSASPSSAPSNEANASVSTAPNATPAGSETANPGQPNGVNQPSQNNGTEGGQPSPSTGAGSTAAAQAGGGTPGNPNGSYIQLKPRGDTEIMSHNMNVPKYRATVFDKYWTPEGESSVDTALRHAVEKTTVSHTFNLPQGVRIKCSVMPLLPSSLFGCTNPDPPAAPLPKKIYDRLNLPSTNPSIPAAPAVAASKAAPAAPVALDNSAECAAARVSGGPMPPDCGASSVPVKPLHVPAPSSSSWVPASDQFH
jgi:hypothetical protein